MTEGVKMQCEAEVSGTPRQVDLGVSATAPARPQKVLSIGDVQAKAAELEEILSDINFDERVDLASRAQGNPQIDTSNPVVTVLNADVDKALLGFVNSMGGFQYVLDKYQRDRATLPITMKVVNAVGSLIGYTPAEIKTLNAKMEVARQGQQGKEVTVDNNAVYKEAALYALDIWEQHVNQVQVGLDEAVQTSIDLEGTIIDLDTGTTVAQVKGGYHATEAAKYDGLMRDAQRQIAEIRSGAARCDADPQDFINALTEQIKRAGEFEEIPFC